MKNLTLPLIIVVSLGILIVGAFALTKQSNSPTPLPSYFEYFWGDGCPKCETVEEFLNSWEKKDEVQIVKKEVWNNQINANLMLERARYCGINPNQGLGVPFLFTPEGQCIIGDAPIIDYLEGLNL